MTEINITTDPVEYITIPIEDDDTTINVTVSGGTGVVRFTDLIDVENSYTGKANYHVVVNSNEDGLEFSSEAADVSWGNIQGTLSNQTDLQNALDLKANSSTLSSHTGDSTIHFEESSIDHTNIQNIGTNTHSDIDSHISNSTIHFSNLDSFDTDDLSEGSTNLYDQTVSITGGTNVTIGGTYPSFTISDNSASASALSTHTGDSTIHFTQGSISITASQISDFDTEVSNNTDVSDSFKKSSDTLDDISNGTTYVKSHNDYTDTEKTKLSGIEAGAEVNNISDTNATDLTDGGNSTLHYHSTDRDRSNHTGTQTASTISDFDTEVSNNTDVSANTTHRGTTSGNPHSVTKSDVGLGNVPNVDCTNASNITTGTLPSSVLPPIAISETYVVASEAAQLALSAQEGDVCVRTDESKSYIQNGGSSGTMADWTELQTPEDSVLSVNGNTGTVVLTQDDIGNGSTYVQTENNFTDTLLSKLNGIESGAEVNDVDSVNSQTGAVILDADDIDDTSTANKFVTASDLTNLSNLSGTNTGDQTSIYGISGTKSQYDTSCSDGNFMFEGDNISDLTNDSGYITSIPDNYLLNTGDTATGDYAFDTDTLVVDSSNHRVGVGISNPTVDFQVDSPDNTKIIISRAGTALAQIGDGSSSNHGQAFLFTQGGDLTVLLQATGLSYLDVTGFGLGTRTPSEMLDVDGNIAVSGTVDGRDIATDGSKLDYITVTQAVDLDSVESLANSAIQPSDNVSELTNDSGYITSSGVTYENLNTNGDVGTGSSQVAAGDHNHDGVYEPAGVSSTDITDSTADGRALITSSDANPFTDADESKLDGIEAGADVTDSTNVDAAGAVMNSDTSTASMSFVIDEDAMGSDSNTKVPTQQSVKAYVDNQNFLSSETVGGSNGDAVYLSGSHTFSQCDASAESTSKGLIGIRISATQVQIGGVYTTSGLTAGSTYYLSETTGAITLTAPTTSGAIVRIIGYALSTTELLIKPSESYVEAA